MIILNFTIDSSPTTKALVTTKYGSKMKVPIIGYALCKREASDWPSGRVTEEEVASVEPVIIPLAILEGRYIHPIDEIASFEGWKEWSFADSWAWEEDVIETAEDIL